MLLRMWRNCNLCTVRENVKPGNHCGKQYGGCFLKKLEIELTYESNCIWVYAQKIKSKVSDICRLIFLTALFTTAKTWKPSKCPSTDNGKAKCGVYTLCERNMKVVRTKMELPVSTPTKINKWSHEVIKKGSYIQLPDSNHSTEVTITLHTRYFYGENCPASLCSTLG